MSDDKKRPRPVVEEIKEEVSQEKVPEENLPEKEHIEKKAKETLEELNKLQNGEKKVKPRKLNIRLVLIITILTAIVVGFVSGGVYIYITGVKSLEIEEKEDIPSSTPTPTPVPTTTPSPEPNEEIDFSAYKINVLNGSGKIGEAGKAKALLEKAEFEVENLGNAASFDFDKTVIQVKKGVPEMVVEKLKDAISEDYSVELGKALTSSSTYDIIITVGAE